MAANGHPVTDGALEPFTPSQVGSVGPACPVEGAIFPLSKSSVDVVPAPLRQDELRKSSSSPTCSRTPPANPAHTPVTHDNQAERAGQPRAPQSQGGGPGGAETLPPRHRVGRPHSIAEMAPPSPRTGTASLSETPASSSQQDLSEEPPGLDPPQPVHRSLSTGLHAAREPPHPPRSESSAPCPGGEYCGRGGPCCPTLVCKQPMQLLQSNTLTTCRSSGSSSPTQQLGGRVRICAPGPPHGEGGAEEPCFLPHGGLEDTFAAYCHPLPIPTPAQLLPRPPGGESERALLAFPRLISSVSETGLDAKRLLGCCRPDCQEQGGAYPVPPRPGGGARVTRETGTMTSRGELRDVGVQTGLPESPPPHVFPRVSLAAGQGPGAGEGPNGAAGGQKSPIKEVLWDAEGMTWEVYGASVDPEELGLAIQKHLELQIKEKASRVAQLVRQDTFSSQHSQQRRKRGFMGSLRTPTCCARSSTGAD